VILVHVLFQNLDPDQDLVLIAEETIRDIVQFRDQIQEIQEEIIEEEHQIMENIKN
jgi:hypothetical protein